jgi:oligopeptidase B
MGENNRFLNLINLKSKDSFAISDQIQSDLVEASFRTQYIFRNGCFWYLFDKWNLPKSGMIRRWPITNTLDWNPKKNYTESLRKNNSRIIFNVKDTKWESLNVIHVILSLDGNNIGILSDESKQNQLIIFSINKTEIVNAISNISKEASFCFVGDKILYARNNVEKRPTKLFSETVTGNNQQLIYEEQDDSYRIRIFGSQFYGYAIVESKTLSNTNIFVYNTKSNPSLIKIWKKSFIMPNSYDLVSIKKEVCICFLITTKESKKVCILSRLSSGDSFVQINFSQDIVAREVMGATNAIILINLRDSHQTINIVRINKIPNESYKYQVKSYGLSGNVQVYQNNYSTQNLFVTQSNDNVNEALISLSLSGGTENVLFQNSIYQGIKNDIQNEIILAQSRDGITKIPISIYWESDSNQIPLKRKGVVTAYGAYGKSEIDYALDPVAIAIINQGYVYCIAHVRGGGYLGGKWYRAGKKLKKWNSIYDLIDCCHFLIDTKMLDSKHIGLLASSAGGIVAGAALNEEPNLFTCILLFSPFINPFGALMDVTDSLASSEVFEWGDPRSSNQVKKYIYSYSPLQNIDKARRSSTMILSVMGGQDIYVSNEDVLHWSSKLRKYGVQSYTYVNPQAGHGGIGVNDVDLLGRVLRYFLFRISKGG